MKAKTIGYARQTSRSAGAAQQRDELEAAGCSPVFIERIERGGGASAQRKLLLRKIEPGVTVVVTSLDRLGTSLDDLTAFLDLIFKAGGQLRSLAEGFDTGARLGGSLKAFEAISHAAKIYRGEVAKDRMVASRERGSQPGRNFALSPSRWPEMKEMIGKIPVKDILAHFQISKQSFYNYRKKMEESDPVPID